MTAVSGQTPNPNSVNRQPLNTFIPGREATDQTSAALQAVDFDTFIKLLVAQLENQDPLNPMDGTEFTAQMAQFAQIEQQLAANNHLEAIAAQNDFGAQGLATSYIGKEVLAPGSEFSMGEGGGLDFAYTLEKSASDVQVEIYDQDGVIVKTLEGGTAAGANYLSWDGTDEDGEAAPAGDYKIRISAVDGEGSRIATESYVYGFTLGVAGSGDNLTLSLADGRDSGFNDILSVRLRVQAVAGGESGS